jgi:hypothetical protein
LIGATIQLSGARGKLRIDERPITNVQPIG